jgi:ribosomal protein S18 acetylase RimI-like enzyme
MAPSTCARSRAADERRNFVRMTLHAPSTNTIAIRRATATDARALASLAAEAFIETFGPDNTPADMAMYLATAFGESVQGGEIADSYNTVLLAERGGEMVGYAMLREGDAPDAVGDPGAIEIVRLYSFTRWIGTGVGAALMQRCLDEASARGRRTVWLGVWERNARAIAFYRRWGFADVGSHPFQLGTDLQTDRLMARSVSEAR